MDNKNSKDYKLLNYNNSQAEKKKKLIIWKFLFDTYSSKNTTHICLVLIWNVKEKSSFVLSIHNDSMMIIYLKPIDKSLQRKLYFFFIDRVFIIHLLSFDTLFFNMNHIWCHYEKKTSEGADEQLKKTKRCIYKWKECLIYGTYIYSYIRLLAFLKIDD
jgi:hypothetical protein